MSGPGRISPKDLLENPDYVQVDQEDTFEGMTLYVFHEPSQTYWRGWYRMRKDDSDYHIATTWVQVKPKVGKKTIYVDVNQKDES